MKGTIKYHKYIKENNPDKIQSQKFHWEYQNQISIAPKNNIIKSIQVSNNNAQNNYKYPYYKAFSGNYHLNKTNNLTNKSKKENENILYSKKQILNNSNKTNTISVKGNNFNNKANKNNIENIGYKSIVVKNSQNVRNKSINSKNKKYNNFDIYDKSNNKFIKYNNNNLIKDNTNNNKNNNKSKGIISELISGINNNKLSFNSNLKFNLLNKGNKLKYPNEYDINNNHSIKVEDKTYKKESQEEGKEIKFENYLCFKCKGKGIIELNLNESLVKMRCSQGHSLENVSIKDFKLKNDDLNNKIKCYLCKNNDIKLKDLYYCSCKKILCLNCLNNNLHNNHTKVKYIEKCYYCFEHNKKYVCFCKKCNKNICNDCFNDHKRHDENKDDNIFYFNKNTPKKTEVQIYKKNLDKIKTQKILFDQKFEKFIDTLKNKKNEFDKNFEDYTELANILINKMNDNNINYEDIISFNNLKLNNNDKNIIQDYLLINNNFNKEGKFLIDLLGKDEIVKETKNQNQIVKGLNNLSIIQNQIKKIKKIQNEITNLNSLSIIAKKIKNKNEISDNINFNILKSNNNHSKDNIICNNINNFIINSNIKNIILKNGVQRNNLTDIDKNIGLINIHQGNNEKADQNIQKGDFNFSNINNINPDTLDENKVNEIPSLENDINKENKKIEKHETTQDIVPEKPKEIKIIEKIEDCKTKLRNKDERCITSFAILRNNRILLTLKGGFIKFYEFKKNINNMPSNIENDNNIYEIELKEILRLEEDEYCFNYGIELFDGNVAVCSEDGTVKIIQLFFDENLAETGEKYKIIQFIEEKNQDPIYTIKEITNHNLVLGCWKNILVFQKANEYELVNKILVGEYTFTILELSPNVIVSSHTESKSLRVHNLINYKIFQINNIESNENNNIICKYNNQNEIVFVAYDKGINIVSIINRCLIQKIELGEIISGLSPMIMDVDIGNGKTTKIFGLLCGAKRKIYGENVNYAYSLLQLGFNINSKNPGIIDLKNDKKIECIELSRKDRIHYYDINNIINSAFCKNIDTLNIIENKGEQWIFSSGNEDKLLSIWKI